MSDKTAGDTRIKSVPLHVEGRGIADISRIRRDLRQLGWPEGGPICNLGSCYPAAS